MRGHRAIGTIVAAVVLCDGSGMGGDTRISSGSTLGEILGDEEDQEEDDQDEVDQSSDAGEVDGADEVGDAGMVGEAPVRWTATAATASDGDSGNGRTAKSRRVPPVPTAAPRSRGWRTAAIVGLIIAGLLSAAIVLLWGQADDASSDAKSARDSSPARPTHRPVSTCSRARSPTSRSSSPT